MISVVIPTLDAERTLPRTLASVEPGVGEGLVSEIIVVDGGSSDATLGIAEAGRCRVFTTERGRGVQLRLGCEKASCEWVLVMHADTRLGPGWVDEVRRHILDAPGKAAYFRLGFDDVSFSARLWEALVLMRCAVFATPYGDQGLLTPKSLYETVGGYPDWPLMEDVELVSRIGRARLVALRCPAITDASRFRRRGWLSRSMRNLGLLVCWRMGTPPEKLARSYD